MAKKLKKARVKGSRVTPRKDARKVLKSVMRDTFKLHDFIVELDHRFTAGYDEISQREDVPAEVLVKMTKITTGKVAESILFVESQDKLCCEAEALVNDFTRPWTEIEEELLGIDLVLHASLDERAAIHAMIMTEAAEIAMEIPDVVPAKKKIIDTPVVQNINAEDFVLNPALADHPAYLVVTDEDGNPLPADSIGDSSEAQKSEPKTLKDPVKLKPEEFVNFNYETDVVLGDGNGYFVERALYDTVMADAPNLPEVALSQNGNVNLTHVPEDYRGGNVSRIINTDGVLQSRTVEGKALPSIEGTHVIWIPTGEDTYVAHTHGVKATYTLGSKTVDITDGDSNTPLSVVIYDGDANLGGFMDDITPASEFVIRDGHPYIIGVDESSGDDVEVRTIMQDGCVAILDDDGNLATLAD